ncbi:MAG: glycosyltransferase [Faunusvirus sp.]|jgi:hypothetical protein|uniref:Glycosyltransferase n=1 Tax=Faunusvirus sp. TaxID=2487766 RepID=A0A3G5A113_9VIRU|nr:MAG: glycosyltransferase [Faunusvirus sp.]
MSDEYIKLTELPEDKLRDIQLSCPGEDEHTYKMPMESEMFYTDKSSPYYGKSRYAYLTLVMLGDLYISAALVLAYSIRLSNTKADIVVLVTNDVTQAGRDALKLVYDRVIEIDYIKVLSDRVRKDPKRQYLNYVFTKFNLFKLVEYEKIILLDADAIVLKYYDHLFTMPTPAGVILNDKDDFIKYDKSGNYVIRKDLKIDWYEKYCAECGHGKSIPRRMTDIVLKDKRKSGIGGGLMLLKPDIKEFDSIMSDLRNSQTQRLIGSFSWPEQQYMCARYSGKWTSINPRFFGLQGYPHWSVLYGLQYGGDKPFIRNTKMPEAERLKYSDYILWHAYYYVILQRYPVLRNLNFLQEVNKFNELFMRQKQPALNLKQLHIIKTDRSYKEIKRKKHISLKYNIPYNKIDRDDIRKYMKKSEKSKVEKQ